MSWLISILLNVIVLWEGLPPSVAISYIVTNWTSWCSSYQAYSIDHYYVLLPWFVPGLAYSEQLIYSWGCLSLRILQNTPGMINTSGWVNSIGTCAGQLKQIVFDGILHYDHKGNHLNWFDFWFLAIIVVFIMPGWKGCQFKVGLCVCQYLNVVNNLWTHAMMWPYVIVLQRMMVKESTTKCIRFYQANQYSTQNLSFYSRTTKPGVG